MPILTITTSQDPVDPIVGTNTLLTSFSVASGTYSSLAAATSSTGSTSTTQLNGAGSTSAGSYLNLDLSSGLANDGASGLNVFFGAELGPSGASGTGNDIFVFELGNGSPNAVFGDDSPSISAIDASGTVIGSPLVVSSSDWGGPRTVNLNIGSTRYAAGIAFDVNDFNGGSPLAGVAGIRFNSSVDFISIGYNTNAVAVPEPSFAAMAMGGLMVVACVIRRRRHCGQG